MRCEKKEEAERYAREAGDESPAYIRSSLREGSSPMHDFYPTSSTFPLRPGLSAWRTASAMRLRSYSASTGGMIRPSAMWAMRSAADFWRAEAGGRWNHSESQNTRSVADLKISVPGGVGIGSMWRA